MRVRRKLHPIDKAGIIIGNVIAAVGFGILTFVSCLAASWLAFALTEWTMHPHIPAIAFALLAIPGFFAAAFYFLSWGMSFDDDHILHYSTLFREEDEKDRL